MAKKLPRISNLALGRVRLGELFIRTEQDRCSFVYSKAYGKRGPKKHSRKAALLAFWRRGFVKDYRP